MDDVAKLFTRLTFGGFLAGHGAQKLLGLFGGDGVAGTSAWMESLGLRPGKIWTYLAAASELGGGALTMLGLLSPLGPLATIGSMSMAALTVHRGKPIWVNQGGAELPAMNIVLAGTLMLTGPGKISLDALLGTDMPRWTAIPGLALLGGTIWYVYQLREEQLARQIGQQTSAA